MKILCADIGGTSIKAAIVLETGNTIEFKEAPTESALGGSHVMENLIRLLRTYEEDYEAIGISTAGQVDSVKGEIIYANENIPGYTGMKVKAVLEEEFSLPVRVENDVNCAALGEAWFGAGKESEDLLCLTYGTGIGGSIIMDRKVYGGESGIAGEFGHMVIHPGGRDCNCGKKGCYESYASARILVQEAMKMDPDCDNGRKLFQRIQEGDVLMTELLDAWAKEVSYGLVNIIHIFNPALIVLGGGVLEQDLAFEAIRKHTFSLIMDSFKNVRLVKASLGNKAGLLGAASLFLNS